MDKVLLVHQKPHVGGGQTYVNNFKKYLQKHRQIDLDIFDGDERWNLIKKIWRFKGKKIIWNVYDERFFIVYLWAKLLGKKNSLIVHGVWFDEAQSGLLPGISFRDRCYVYRGMINAMIFQFMFLLLTDVIFHLSQYGKKIFYDVAIFRIFRHRKQVNIYAGVDPKIFFPLTGRQKLALRDELGIKKDDLILLIAGRMEKRKNYLEALDVLKELIEQLPNRNVFLYFVTVFGQSNQEQYPVIFYEKCHQLGLGKQVRLISGLDNQELNVFYQVADAFLMLSKHFETFGLVTGEALGCACPVFAYQACAHGEIILHQPTKFLAEVGNSQQLAILMKEYFNLSSARRNQINRTLSQSFNQHFSWKKTADLIAQALLSL